MIELDLAQPPIVAPNIRVRVRDAFDIGPGSIIDDFSYFSTRVRVGRCSHIASCVTIGGGRKWLFTLGDFSSVSAGVRIWCASEDFWRDLAAPVPDGVALDKHLVTGDVHIGNCCIIGANSVVLPGNTIPDGVAIGALSLVPEGFPFEPWMLYAGTPIRMLGPRDRTTIEQQKDALVRALAERAGTPAEVEP